MIADIENHLARFFARVIDLEWPERKDAFFNETIESGGTYTIPRGENWPASHMAEISLHGISGFGASEEEAIGNWIKSAGRTLAAQSDEVAA